MMHSPKSLFSDFVPNRLHDGMAGSAAVELPARMENQLHDQAITLPSVLSALSGVQDKGAGKYMALCPAHDDRTPSLSVREGDNGAVLLHCFAGCDYERVLASLKLDSSPTISPTVSKRTWERVFGRNTTITTYNYCDDSGKIVHQVVRHEWQERDTETGETRRRKNFSQKRPDGKGGFVPNLDGVTRVPFRLREVQEAIRQRKTVFWPEGEKDVENLVSAGLEATTTAQGANGYLSKYGYAAYFAGANVVLLPDNDVEGRKYAQIVANSLHGVAASVKILELPGLPAKGDVSDFLQAGGTAAQIVLLADAVEQRLPHQPVPITSPLAPPPASKMSPLILPEAALYGIAGRIVRVLNPHTESDSAAILLQLLAAFGNVIGKGAHCRVESDKHYANLFVAIVGQSGRSRKGTSWGHVRALFHDVDPDWSEKRVKSGLSSGEGLIYAVQDDASVTDKRLLASESEFATVLRVMEREGNTISARLRDGWDGRTISTLTRNNPLIATGAHISLVGHITRDELLRYMTKTETANGFANRILWASAGRSKLLPDGGEFVTDPQRPELVEELTEAVQFARTAGEVRRDVEARALWHEVYAELTGDVPGLFGAVTSRAEAQTLRLSLLYALLDRSDVVRLRHLESALALWRYCSESVQLLRIWSARRIFGDAMGDSKADTILYGLREAGARGLTRTEISNLFRRNISADQIARALDMLTSARRVRCQEEATDGRSAERWFVVEESQPFQRTNEGNETRTFADTKRALNSSISSFRSGVSGVIAECDVPSDMALGPLLEEAR